MAFYEVVTDTGVSVNRSDVEVITLFRSVGHQTFLVNTDAAGAASLRQEDGVLSVEPAVDGLYIDEVSGAYEVSELGARIRHIGS